MRFNVDDLIAKKLVTKKTYTEGPFADLSVLKYKNNVFWNNLWHTDARLLECRGMVVDQDDNVIIWPFTKIFNRFENDTDLAKDKLVTCVRKVNGFMASASIYNGEWLVSTTGTLDSDFAKLANKMINFDAMPLSLLNSKTWESLTLIFEICHESDPHIVQEDLGVYLIGARIKENGHMVSESGLDVLCLPHWKRPEWHNMYFSDVVELSKKVKHEGFVIRDVNSGDLLLKIKSPHYLAKKFLMRGSQNKWDMIWDNPKEAKKRIDEEYYALLDWIRVTYTKCEWSGLDSQQRRSVVEHYFSAKETLN